MGRNRQGTAITRNVSESTLFWEHIEQQRVQRVVDKKRSGKHLPTQRCEMQGGTTMVGLGTYVCPQRDHRA